VFIEDQDDRAFNYGQDPNYRELTPDSILAFAGPRSSLSESHILVKTHVGNAPDAISVHWGKRQFSV
jgi:hypothetical protein